MSDQWAADLAGRVAAQIRTLRGERSAQWLSDRTAELGHRISRSTISEIENGRRLTIALDAVIVIAAALEVPVAHLLYPPEGPLLVEALPGCSVPRPDAVEALAGTTADVEADRRRIEELMTVMDTARESIRKLREKFGNGR